MAAPVWTWQLCDQTGSALGELATATGRRLTFKRNWFGEAACTISPDDDIAVLLWAYLRNQGIPTLKGWRDGVCRFKGSLVPFTEEAEETATMSLVFRTPFARLLGDGPGTGRFLYPGLGIGSTTSEPLVYTQQAGGTIATALLALANSDGATGVSIGNVDSTVLRDRSYDAGQNIGEAIVNLTNVLDGFDFIERFTSEQAITSYLDIFQSLGAVQTNARFEYGPDTMNNVRRVQRTVTPPVNFVYVQGANGLYSVARNAASRLKYGTWGLRDSRTDISEQSTLDARAQALLRPEPSYTVQISPDPGLAPRPWDGYDLGDTVRIYVRRGAMLVDTTARVNAYSVVIDDDGLEAFEIPDPRMPDEEAALRTNLITEVVPGV